MEYEKEILAEMSHSLSTDQKNIQTVPIPGSINITPIGSSMEYMEYLKVFFFVLDINTTFPRLLAKATRIKKGHIKRAFVSL